MCSFELGPLTQETVVTGDAPLVDTTTAAVSGLVGEREVKDLPLNGRSFDSLLTLNPRRCQLRTQKRPNQHQQRQHIQCCRPASGRQSHPFERH